jgi:hypothetical protein
LCTFLGILLGETPTSLRSFATRFLDVSVWIDEHFFFVPNVSVIISGSLVVSAGGSGVDVLLLLLYKGSNLLETLLYFLINSSFFSLRF